MVCCAFFSLRLDYVIEADNIHNIFLSDISGRDMSQGSGPYVSVIFMTSCASFHIRIPQWALLVQISVACCYYLACLVARYRDPFSAVIPHDTFATAMCAVGLGMFISLGRPSREVGCFRSSMRISVPGVRTILLSLIAFQNFLPKRVFFF